MSTAKKTNGERMIVILGSGKLAGRVADELERWGKASIVIDDLDELDSIEFVDALLISDDMDLGEKYDFPVVYYDVFNSKETPEDVDVLLNNTTMIASFLIAEINKYREIRRTSKLVQYMKRLDDEMSVFLHDNPDPDAIASAMAFQELCDRFDIDCNIYYSGEIGHPENELFVETTGVNIEHISDDEILTIIEEDKPLVFLDFSLPAVNNSLPRTAVPEVVIDHHPSDSPRSEGGYIQIETRAGATSTLMSEHLINADIEISSLLASSLLHGIKVDTHGFIKNISKSDLRAMSKLIPLCDSELLDVLERPPMNPSTISSLGTAIINREISKGILTSYAGEVSTKDDLPQIVDMLVTERDVHTAVVFGRIENTIHMSARSMLTDMDLGAIMYNAFSDIGEAGGHPHAAAGYVHIKEEVFDSKAIKKLSNRFKKEVKKHE